MLTVSNITKKFYRHEVLRGVSFNLAQGGLYGLIGPSGGGKSVLLKIISGITEPDSGTVDQGVSDKHEIGFMFQEGALFDSISVIDNVAFPLVDGKVPTTILPYSRRCEVHARAEEILGKVGLSKAAYKMPAQISGGMRRRVSLARAIVSKPKVLLLDDPTAGLDPVASSVIMELIRDMHREYRPTTLIISQDLRRLLPTVDHIFGLFAGKIAFSGPASELASSAEDVQRFVACRSDLNQRRISPLGAQSERR